MNITSTQVTSNYPNNSTRPSHADFRTADMPTKGTDPGYTNPAAPSKPDFKVDPGFTNPEKPVYDKPTVDAGMEEEVVAAKQQYKEVSIAEYKADYVLESQQLYVETYNHYSDLYSGEEDSSSSPSNGAEIAHNSWETYEKAQDLGDQIKKYETKEDIADKPVKSDIPNFADYGVPAQGKAGASSNVGSNIDMLV